MRQTAAAFGICITRGALKTCESCAIAKAKQKNMNDESKGEKADKYNGRVTMTLQLSRKARMTSLLVEERYNKL